VQATENRKNPKFKGENVQQVERKQDHRHNGCSRCNNVQGKKPQLGTADVASI